MKETESDDSNLTHASAMALVGAFVAFSVGLKGEWNVLFCFTEKYEPPRKCCMGGLEMLT